MAVACYETITTIITQYRGARRSKKHHIWRKHKYLIWSQAFSHYRDLSSAFPEIHLQTNLSLVSVSFTSTIVHCWGKSAEWEILEADGRVWRLSCEHSKESESMKSLDKILNRSLQFERGNAASMTRLWGPRNPALPLNESLLPFWHLVCADSSSAELI